MDRTAWIAVTLCVLGLVAWEIYVARQRLPQPQPVARPATSTFTPEPTAPIATVSPTPAVANAAAAVSPAPPTPQSFPQKTETLRNSDIELHLTNRGGGINEVVLPKYAAEDNKRVTLNSPERTPIGAIISDPAAPELPEYKLNRTGDQVEAEYVTPDQITVRKRISLGPAAERDNYLARMDVEFVNGDTKPYVNPGYFLSVGSARPVHRNDYASFTRVVWCVNGTAKGIDVGWFAPSNGIFGVVGQRPGRPYYTENIKGAEWVAASNQFFTTLIAPLSEKADAVWAQRFEVDQTQTLFGIEGAMHLAGFTLKPGETRSTHFQFYAGPKLYHRLAQLEHNEAEVMELGFFKLISQALLNALNTLHSVLGNYAAAILALTTIIKLALWPLQNRANASMRRMSALSPKMQELRVKYKDDPTRMNQEVMKLYKEHGVNPVGGCLPMLIQIPIFFGLFTMLRQAVELRGASFFWIHDLSQPDTVAHIPGLGWPINVLPLIMAATSFWMTHLTPKSGDPTQQRMMMFTPIIFIIFCYNFAAALALYYTTQNLLTVLQLYVNKRQPVPVPTKVTPPARLSKKRR
jgi:membrane protein insertase, YidC/Oxa1 family, C-terminal domain